MSVTLGHNQYGKAETRVVRVYRDSDPHEIVDYNVSVALSGISRTSTSLATTPNASPPMRPRTR